MMVSGYPSSDEESTAYHTPSTSVVGRSFIGAGGGGTTPKNKLLTNGSLLTRSLKKKQQESTKTTGSAARKSNRNDPTSSGQVKKDMNFVEERPCQNTGVLLRVLLEGPRINVFYDNLGEGEFDM